MKCYKCGSEMRVVPEQVATDEKGLPVYHRIGYCDSCMAKFDIDIVEQQNKKKKKQSILSILSVVFTLLGLTIPVAIILAIIDIVKGDKNNKNHSGSWFSIIFSVIVILVYFLGGQNVENQNRHRDYKPSVCFDNRQDDAQKKKQFNHHRNLSLTLIQSFMLSALPISNFLFHLFCGSFAYTKSIRINHPIIEDQYAGLGLHCKTTMKDICQFHDSHSDLRLNL